ncbi:hypothetical protein ACF067_28335 [Streptomyces albidoflavus]|uniref:hypothetical protein n=1 Tax=Streptomyces albidoflavus TaxID=1886 RepID=UPI001F5D98D0|nr:hypothetical protein [Streptomyces albidoflavus]
MTPADRTKSVKVLANGYYAFYDLHRPTYHAYATAHLSPEEAQIAVANVFALVAENWTSIVTEQHPARWGWTRHTRTVARRSGHIPTRVQDACLLHERLHLAVKQISTTTGQDPANDTTLLAAGERSDPAPGQRPRVRLRTNAAPTSSLEARWRAALRLRTSQALPTN